MELRTDTETTRHFHCKSIGCQVSLLRVHAWCSASLAGAGCSPPACELPEPGGGLAQPLVGRGGVRRWNKSGASLH